MLLEALRDLAPTTLLSVSAAGGAAVDAYAAEHPECELTRIEPFPARPLPAGAGRFDLGVVTGLLEILPQDQARALVATLRDRHCRAVLLLAPKGHWPLADFLALGFERRAQDAAHELYWFDMDRYNPQREWNNPTHWANPENFKRFRW